MSNYYNSQVPVFIRITTAHPELILINEDKRLNNLRNTAPHRTALASRQSTGAFVSRFIGTFETSDSRLKLMVLVMLTYLCLYLIKEKISE